MQKSIAEIEQHDRSQDLHPRGRGAQFGCAVCAARLEIVNAGLCDTRFGVPGLYDVYRCSDCNLEQTLPIPSASELKLLYEQYYNYAEKPGTRYRRWRDAFFSSFLSRMWTSIDGDISFYVRKGAGRLLDVGCNEGRGLRFYSKNGFQVEGLELSGTAAATARQFGKVHNCVLHEFFPELPFDVAVLSNVLEHSPSPHQMLKEVRRILAAGGQVWISCPNSRSWLRGVFGRSWLNWHVPFHLFHFSDKTLRKLLQDSGFSVVEMKQITPALWVAQSVLIYLFARERRKTRQMRNPLLTMFFTLTARFLLFPLLWLGNKIGRGDCLLVVARKA